MSTSFPGHLRVHFGYSYSSRFIEMRCYVHGAVTVITGCYDDDGIGDPEVVAAPDAILRCWVSTDGGSFFGEMMAWLEAIAAGVRECAFIWDASGSDGEMRWHRDVEGSGHLEVKWSGGHQCPAFDHEAKLSRRQLVDAMYRAFVDLIESEDYDPILYESMTDGEAFDLTVTEGSSALAEEIARHDRSSAFHLVRAVSRRSRDYEKGPRRIEDLATFVRMANSMPHVDLTDEMECDHIEFLLGKSWDQLPFEERLAYVHQVVFGFRSDGLTGDRLRELRSERIEAWLLEQPEEAKRGVR